MLSNILWSIASGKSSTPLHKVVTWQTLAEIIALHNLDSWKCAVMYSIKKKKFNTKIPLWCSCEFQYCPPLLFSCNECVNQRCWMQSMVYTDKITRAYCSEQKWIICNTNHVYPKQKWLYSLALFFLIQINFFRGIWYWNLNIATTQCCCNRLL